MLNKFFAWLEQDLSRGRKVALIAIVASFIFVSYIVLALVAFNIPVAEYVPYYIAYVGVVMVIIKYYTTTTAGSTKLDKKLIEEIKNVVSKSKE